jgi:hypothetical protein
MRQEKNRKSGFQRCEGQDLGGGSRGQLRRVPLDVGGDFRELVPVRRFFDPPESGADRRPLRASWGRLRDPCRGVGLESRERAPTPSRPPRQQGRFVQIEKYTGGTTIRLITSRPGHHVTCTFVFQVIIHPQFSLKSLVNDIAVVIVERAFRMGDHVGVVCLPPQNSAPIPEECVVTGWGKTSYKSVNGFENVLKKGNFPVVHNDDCEAALQGALLGPGFRLHDSFMCAGGGPKKDACKGDGGSPLVCLVEGEEDRYEQFGIVAWGLVCGLTDAPGVYVGVARFIDWIDRQMATHHLDPQIYKYH